MTDKTAVQQIEDILETLNQMNVDEEIPYSAYTQLHDAVSLVSGALETKPDKSWVAKSPEYLFEDPEPVVVPAEFFDTLKNTRAGEELVLNEDLTKAMECWDTEHVAKYPQEAYNYMKAMANELDRLSGKTEEEE